MTTLKFTLDDDDNLHIEDDFDQKTYEAIEAYFKVILGV